MSIFSDGRAAVVDLHRGRPDSSRTAPVSDSSRRQSERRLADLLKGLRCRRPWDSAEHAQSVRASSSVATRAKSTGSPCCTGPREPRTRFLRVKIEAGKAVRKAQNVLLSIYGHPTTSLTPNGGGTRHERGPAVRHHQSSALRLGIVRDPLGNDRRLTGPAARGAPGASRPRSPPHTRRSTRVN